MRTLVSRPLFAGAAGGLLVGAFFWIAIATGLIEAEAERQPTLAAATPTEPVAEGDALTAGEIYERAGPAVAFIAAERGDRPPSPLNPMPQPGPTASGSGFLFDEQGHVLTNAHVVDGSEKVTVKLGEDGEELGAELLGADNSTDVAVLRIDPDKVDAAPLSFGDSDRARVGDPVVAIGNPFGLDRTVTTGIVSALQREISAPNGFAISDVIQTDAAINPGNSGGPLIDASGEVIGINSQIATAGAGGGNVGVGFAVPISTASDIAAQIIDDGEAEHAFIGISGADIDPEIADLLNLDVEEGVLIQQVTPGSPADDAGLRAGEATMGIDGRELRAGGDIVTEADGEKLSGMEDLVAAVNAKQPGNTITLTVHRGDTEKQVEIELANRPDQAGG